MVVEMGEFPTGKIEEDLRMKTALELLVSFEKHLGVLVEEFLTSEIANQKLLQTSSRLLSLGYHYLSFSCQTLFAQDSLVRRCGRSDYKVRTEIIKSELRL